MKTRTGEEGFRNLKIKYRSWVEEMSLSKKPSIKNLCDGESSLGQEEIYVK